jgi:catechol 2,3-dioxygenase-like lactoylglutathione lyase family enzyme
MTNTSILSKSKLVGFVATRDQGRAKAFYRDVLGLRLVSEDQFATVFDANGTTLRVSPVRELAPAQYTVLGWEVTDIAAAVAAMSRLGVKFEQYGFPTQDAQGVWSAPGGAKVAWFKDPDGNVLSIAQH